jgi:hypothetical protein
MSDGAEGSGRQKLLGLPNVQVVFITPFFKAFFA